MGFEHGKVHEGIAIQFGSLVCRTYAAPPAGLLY